MADGPQASPDQASTTSFDWKAFLQKTWVIVASGIIFPPVAMILTWLKPDWSTRTKWIATGVLGLMLVARNQATTEAPSQQQQASVSAEAPQVETRGVEGPGATRNRRLQEQQEELRKRQEEGAEIGRNLTKAGNSDLCRRMKSQLEYDIKQLEQIIVKNKQYGHDPSESLLHDVELARARYKGFLSTCRGF